LTLRRHLIVYAAPPDRLQVFRLIVDGWLRLIGRLGVEPLPGRSNIDRCAARINVPVDPVIRDA
jgi:hypothetical protein